MAEHAQFKFVMTECSKTQIRLTGPNYGHNRYESFVKLNSFTCLTMMFPRLSYVLRSTHWKYLYLCPPKQPPYMKERFHSPDPVKCLLFVFFNNFISLFSTLNIHIKITLNEKLA